MLNAKSPAHTPQYIRLARTHGVSLCYIVVMLSCAIGSGFFQTRKESVARIPSMTFEAPITKVRFFLTIPNFVSLYGQCLLQLLSK